MGAADNELDPRGCAWLAVRFLGCMASLYIIMLLAILTAGGILMLIFG
ncbi:MAG TPA: hypothetical protein VF212_05745 [Longimicrobiales bacterium]